MSMPAIVVNEQVVSMGKVLKAAQVEELLKKLGCQKEVKNQKQKALVLIQYMEANGQHSRLISEIPEVDMAISMGCNVGCPFIGRAFDDNWGLKIQQENRTKNSGLLSVRQKRKYMN